MGWIALSMTAIVIGALVGLWIGNALVAPPRGPGSIVVVAAKLLAAMALGATIDVAIALLVARVVGVRRALLSQLGLAALATLVWIATRIAEGAWR